MFESSRSLSNIHFGQQVGSCCHRLCDPLRNHLSPANQLRYSSRWLLALRLYSSARCPRQLVTVWGRTFLAQVIDDILNSCSPQYEVTASYHSQTNELTERLNWTLTDIPFIYVSTDHHDWDIALPYVTFVYNYFHHGTAGYSPFYLLFRCEPTLPLDTFLRASAVYRRIRSQCYCSRWPRPSACPQDVDCFSTNAEALLLWVSLQRTIPSGFYRSFLVSNATCRPFREAFSFHGPIPHTSISNRHYLWNCPRSPHNLVACVISSLDSLINAQALPPTFSTVAT